MRSCETCIYNDPEDDFWECSKKAIKPCADYIPIDGAEESEDGE